MFYVIQRFHNDAKRHFISYKVPKFISSPKSKNVIFEVTVEGQTKRKWAPKEDIILLTDDSTFFEKTLTQLRGIETEHLEQIDTAEKQLKSSVSHYAKAMHSAFEDLQTTLKNEGIPSLI